MHIETKNISHDFLTASGELPVLKNLSFSVAKGAFVALVGPSGCGKSTITRLLSGLLHPKKGEVLISGQRVLNPRSSIGMAFQNPVLLEWRNVLNNIILPLEIVAKSSSLGKRKMRAQELLKLVGLTKFEMNRPSELSGGMKQRISLCRALVHKPELLILDEPFGALDAITRTTLQKELLRIWSETKKSILFVTHDIEEAVYLSDRVLLIGGKPAQIIEEYNISISRKLRREHSEFLDIVKDIRKGLQSFFGATVIPIV